MRGFFQMAKRSASVAQSTSTKTSSTLRGPSAAKGIYGNDLPNTLRGTAGGDYIDGRGGDDRIFAGGGTDYVLGGLGNDYIDGGTNYDQMNGGAGNDTYVVD